MRVEHFQFGCVLEWDARTRCVKDLNMHHIILGGSRSQKLQQDSGSVPFSVCDHEQYFDDSDERLFSFAIDFLVCVVPV